MRGQGLRPGKDNEMTLQEILAANPYSVGNCSQTSVYPVREVVSRSLGSYPMQDMRRTTRTERVLDIAIDSAVRAGSIAIATALVGALIRKFR